MEDVVLLEMKRREEKGDLSLFHKYHKLADLIYEEFPIEDREREFNKLHEGLYLQLGFGEVISKALREFPELGKVGEIFIGKATPSHEEGADLDKDLKSIGIKVRLHRFLDTTSLQKYLRHELMHIRDMLSEDFKYKYEERLSGISSMEENIIRNRYKVIWDIYVDSRLIRGGKETISDKEGRWREFEVLYQKIPYHQRKAIFENLWEENALTHSKILEIAKDTHKLLERVEEPSEEGLQGREETALLPGSLCPLCRFPTFTWVDGTELEEFIRLIKEDFPGWEKDIGACERCIEAYEVRALII